jgi:hypothetical protein
MDDPDSQSTEAANINGDQFTRPPLLRRRFVIELDISRAAFDEKALTLMEDLQRDGDFDLKQMKERWEFRLEVKDKIPRPKVRLTHSPQIIRSARESRPKTSLELFPPVDNQAARFILEQDRSDEHPTRFEDLEAEIHQWLPRVMEHFDVERAGGFALLYENEFRRARYPEFWDVGNKMFLGKLLRLFQNEIARDGFVTPLSIEFNTMAPELPHSRVLFQLKTMNQSEQEVALSLNLEFTSLTREQRVTRDQAWAEIRKAHELLLDSFARHLSPEALKAFTP